MTEPCAGVRSIASEADDKRQATQRTRHGADTCGVTDYQAALDAATPYFPVVGYLLVVTALLYGLRRVPVWVHPAALIVGLPLRALSTPVLETVLTFSAAAVVFVGLVMVAARTVSGVSLFAITVGLALTPFAGWPGLLCGLLAAAVAAGVRTWRSMGKARLWWLTHDTLSGLGISTTGFKVPQPEHIPTRDLLMTDEHGNAHKRMHLPPYLLCGVLVAAAVAVISL